MEQMKVLLTADLHFRLDWFRWLIEQAPNYDLVCIVGDLLDMFEVKSTREQAREVTGLIKRLADIVPVAVCSGNHDNAGGLVSHDRASLYKWLVDLGAHPNIITDGAIRKLEDLILTTIPYHCSKEEKSIWLDRGLTIRRQTGKPWMVLLTFRPRLGRELAARNRKPPDFFWPIGPITCFRSRPCISLQIRSKLEPENGRSVRAGC
jgi:Calcineurin-like phosphoesterase